MTREEAISYSGELERYETGRNYRTLVFKDGSSYDIYPHTEGYELDETILEFVKPYGDKFSMVRDPKEAAKGADVVYTDVWSSMGQEGEAAQRRAAFEGIYQVNSDLMSVTNDECMVLHCLPAHRDEEITDEVLEAHANEIFDEAENRLHAQKAVLVTLMKD